MLYLMLKVDKYKKNNYFLKVWAWNTPKAGKLSTNIELSTNLYFVRLLHQPVFLLLFERGLTVMHKNIVVQKKIWCEMVCTRSGDSSYIRLVESHVEACSWCTKGILQWSSNRMDRKASIVCTFDRFAGKWNRTQICEP